MPRHKSACYRICCLSSNGCWRARVTKTRNPAKVIEDLMNQGISRDDIKVELRPGTGVKMPMPKGPPKPRLTEGG